MTRSAQAGRQTTLKDHVTIAGIGVHSGAPANLTLHPAEAASLLDWMHKVVLTRGAMSPKDFDLVCLTDDVEEAAEMATRPLPLEIEEPQTEADEPKAEAR